MIDLCKIFGVEEGEEFRFKHENFKDNELIYKVNNGLRCKVYGGDFIRSDLRLNDLLNVKEIIKLPKKKEFKDDELAIMRSLPKEYEWIARDKATDIVCAYGSKPKKSEYKTWHSESSYYAILGIFNHLFNSIQWEDEEPVYIDDYVERGAE
jgi:hypothetical protein